MAWTQGSPPEEPKQLWHSSGAHEKGSSNAIGFANAEVDSIIQDLQYEYNPEKRIALYHRFDAIIHEEAPYTFCTHPNRYFFIESMSKTCLYPLIVKT